MALSEEEEAVEEIHTEAEDGGANEEIPNELTASWLQLKKQREIMPHVWFDILKMREHHYSTMLLWTFCMPVFCPIADLRPSSKRTDTSKSTWK